MIFQKCSDVAINELCKATHYNMVKKTKIIPFRCDVQHLTKMLCVTL